MDIKILVILFSVIILAIFLYYGFRSFEQANLYFPDRNLTGSPRDFGLTYEDVKLRPDAETLIHGWWLPNANPGAAILFLHGNAGNIGNRLETLLKLSRLGFSVLIIDYRGFGQSSGKPSEAGLYRDALAGYLFLTKNKKIPPGDIVLFGESLGGAVAAGLAARVPVRSIITEGTLSSVIDMAKVIYPFLPARFLVRQKFDAAQKLSLLDIPKLVIHSRNDEVVPFKLGEKLFQAAKEPKEFLAVQGGHTSARFDSGPAYWDKIVNFINLNAARR